jgi:hypothetical protein
MIEEFEYDVAFSFNALDEGVATQLNDLLSPRLKTFIYSERQREIAGTDGQESFSKVYGKTSRLVVVLFRPEWGETPWTRIERDAIKNRSLGFHNLRADGRASANATLAATDTTLCRSSALGNGSRRRRDRSSGYRAGQQPP